MKRITALLLSLLMVLTLCVPAMAAKKVTSPVDYSYVALGDSIPNIARVDTLPTQLYPAVLATSLSAEHPEIQCNVSNLSYKGWRTGELRYILDSSYAPDDFTKHMLQYYGGCTMDEMSEFRTTYPAMIADADLISIELGSNDIFGNTLFNAGLGLFKGVDTTLLEGLLDKLLSAGDLLTTLRDRDIPTNPAELAELISALANLSPLNVDADMIDALLAGDLDLDAHAVATLLPTLFSLLSIISDIEMNFRENWDSIIRNIRKINPTATIVAVSLYLPPKIGDIEIASVLISPLIKKMNRYIREGSPYSHEYVYVDVTGVPMWDNQDGSHPGPNGHMYMALQIQAELKKNKQPCLHARTTTRHALHTPIFQYGYSGDTYCRDCGMLLHRGTVKNLIGDPIQIPRNIGLDTYAHVATMVSHTLHRVFPYFI